MAQVAEPGLFGGADSQLKGLKKKRVRKYTYKCKEVSSYKIFAQYVKTEDGKVDASGIVSTNCYVAWVKSRRKAPKKPEEAFRRAVTAHCRGVDGRKAFPPKVEESLLHVLRQKKPWPCFENSKTCGSIGVQGFPSLGFHEKQLRKNQKNYTDEVSEEKGKKQSNTNGKKASFKRPRSEIGLADGKQPKHQKSNQPTFQVTSNGIEIHSALQQLAQPKLEAMQSNQAAETLESLKTQAAAATQAGLVFPINQMQLNPALFQQLPLMPFGNLLTAATSPLGLYAFNPALLNQLNVQLQSPTNKQEPNVTNTQNQ